MQGIARNPAASVAKPRGAGPKSVFQGEVARLAEPRRVVVAVDVVVAVAVAGHSGRADRGNELEAVDWQAKAMGHRGPLPGTRASSGRKDGAQSRAAGQQIGAFEESPANSGQQLARVRHQASREVEHGEA